MQIAFAAAACVAASTLLAVAFDRIQRRALIVRDHGHCRFPGCELRTCDIHHLEHYGDGGRTEVGNGILACPRHHTLLHEGGFRTIGDANDLMFLRPDGTPLEP